MVSMEKSTFEFGKALKKAIANIAVAEDKNKQIVKHELGVSLGRTGDSAIQYWQKGHIPSNIEDLEKLVQVLVRRKGITEKTHLLKFLNSSGHPNFSKFYDELSPQLLKEETFSFIETNHQDWGEAPDPNNFFGRKQEILEIERSISLNSYRVVALLGMGGIGKTMMAAKVAQEVSGQYDYLIWRSVREAPPLKTIIEEFVRFLSQQAVESLSNDLDAQIASLLGYLRKGRCLLILDNLESVMQSGSHAGSYREGYEGYGRFIRAISESEHMGCLLLTSREKPKELNLLNGNTPAVHCFTISGLDVVDTQAMLKDASIGGTENDWAEMGRLSGGNPLVLKVVAGTIQNLFDGKLERFLTEGGVIFGDIRNVLNEQFERLTLFEQNVIYWLSVEREPVSLDALYQDLGTSVLRSDLLDALDSLKRRSLVEKTSLGFTLQNVVMEYVTDRLVARCVDEINNHTMKILSNISLAKATARDYVRESQLRLIVKPMADMLLAANAIADIEVLLKEKLAWLQRFQRQKPSYSLGNLITLLTQLGISLDGYDFSDLVIWEVDFQNVNLENSNFSHSRFDRCSFTQTFGNIISIAFSPSGQHIAAGTQTGDILMWELKTRRLIFTFRGHTDWVRALCFSENGAELFSASDDQTVRMWNAKTGDPIKLFAGHNGRVMTLAINPEKHLLVSGGEDKFIRVWDMLTGNCIKEFKGHKSTVSSLKFSPNKDFLLSASTDTTIKFWETTSYTCIKSIQAHKSYIWTAVFSKDGSFFASGGNDGTVRIWKGRNGSPIRTINIPEMQVRHIAISPEGDKVAAAISDSQFLRVWDVKTGQQIKAIAGHENILWAVEFSPKGDVLASGGYDNSLRVWSAQDLSSIFSFKGYRIGLASLSFSPINPTTLVSTYNDGVARLWNIETGQNRSFSIKAGQPIWKAAFNPIATMIACSSTNGLVYLVDAETGRTLKSFKETSRPFGAATFSPDGQMLITSGTIASIWDIKTNSLLASLPIGPETYFLAFEPNKKWLFVAGEGGTIQCWDIEHKELLHAFRGHSSVVWSLSYNEKVQRLASSSSDHTVRVWDLEKMEQAAVLEGHEDQVKSVSFHPSGKLIASGGYDNKIRIWDAQSFKCLYTLSAHEDVVWSVAFNCNGQILASGSRDGSIRIWETINFECIKVLRVSRPYENMNITSAIGLNETQKENLLLLGAIDEETLAL